VASDSYVCVVCGATNDLWRIRDRSCRALVCDDHYDMLENPTVKHLPLKERLEGLGVKFGDQPMDESYTDQDFCRDIGVKYPEPWEMWAAMHEKDDVKELEDGKHDVLKKRTRSNRKL